MDKPLRMAKLVAIAIPIAGIILLVVVGLGYAADNTALVRPSYLEYRAMERDNAVKAWRSRHPHDNVVADNIIARTPVDCAKIKKELYDVRLQAAPFAGLIQKGYADNAAVVADNVMLGRIIAAEKRLRRAEHEHQRGGCY
jgi:hypothetical protein